MNENMLHITVQQSKLLTNALRIKIIKLLVDSPKTAKQVTDLLQESGGNIHYHIKKLYDGKLLDIVEERKLGGVTEKYYQSKSKWFSSDIAPDPVLNTPSLSRDTTLISIRMELTKDQHLQLTQDFRDFLEHWVDKTISSPSLHEDRQEFSIGVNIISTIEKA